MISGQMLLDELECLEQSLEEILQSSLSQKQLPRPTQQGSNPLQEQHGAVIGMSPESCGLDLEMIRHFIREAGIEDTLIKSLIFLLSKCIKARGEVHVGPLNPSQTLLELSKLIESDFCDDYIIHEIPKALARYGKVIKEKLSQADGCGSTYVNAKFLGMVDAVYGDASPHFHKGLEILGGLPHPRIEDEMQNEFLASKDSHASFEAWNSGMNVTTSAIEWDFVTEPFQKQSVCSTTSPSKWLQRYQFSYNFDDLDKDKSGYCTLDEFKAVLLQNRWSETQIMSIFSTMSRTNHNKISRDEFSTVGGGRTPIRLQVFLHALSSSQKLKDGMVQFGDYKTAHLRPQDDLMWLHEEELGMVKMVVLRFVKSQLDGISLINALSRKDAFQHVPDPDTRAEKISEVLSVLMHDSACTFESISSSDAVKDLISVIELDALIDYFHAKLAHVKFTRPEVIGLRLYSGPPFIKLNGALRAASGMFPAKSAALLQENKYLNTIYATTSGLRKLALVTAIPKTGKVYRGMAGVKLPEKFLKAKEGGGRGGVEFGFMSTTTSKSVAVSYIAEGRALPIMFEFAMGDIDRGASISFISQFPGEDEILIPPLSYLEVTGEPFIENTEKGNITVFPGRISCNLKSQTIEEIETKRHHDLVAMMPYLYNDLCRDLDVLSGLMQQNDLLVDDKTYRADDGCTFIPESVDSCDEKEIQEWFSTPLLHGIPTSVELHCMWRSVGSGHSKASLYARASGSSQWTVLSNEKADQKLRPFQVELPSSVFSDAGKGSDQLKLQLGYFHGDGVLEICDAKLIIQGAQVRKMSIQQHAHRTGKEREIFSQIWKDFEGTEPQRFNDDNLFKEAINTAISFRTECLRRLLEVDCPLHRLILLPREQYELLLELGFPIDEQDQDGQSALMLASRQGLHDIVDTLLRRGARTDLVDKDNYSSLMLACKYGHEQTALKLLAPTTRAGAINIKTADDRTAMILATKKGLNSVLKAYDSICQLTASAGYYTGLYKPAESEIDSQYNYEMCLDTNKITPTRLEITYLVTEHPSADLVGKCGVETYQGAWDKGVFFGTSVGLRALGDLENVHQILGRTPVLRAEEVDGAYILQIPDVGSFHQSILRRCPQENVSAQHLLNRGSA